MAELNKKTVSKIQVIGPKDNTNGAEILQFYRFGKKKMIDIVKGQVLTVGADKDADLTEEEASNLIRFSRWEVKEVKS